MSNVTVYVPTPLRRLTAGTAHVVVDVEPDATLAQVVDRLDALHPGMKAELWEGDDFKHYVNVYLNGEEVRGHGGTAASVSDGDQVAFVPMLAGGAETLVVDRTVLESMYAHANEDYPNECCGLLSGRGCDATRIHRMRNVEASPVMYLMDPKEQLDVFDRIDRDGEELIAIYHSHTHSPAYPSQTDVRLAYYPETVYVIVSLAQREQPDARAFRIVDGQISELEVTVR